MDRLRRAVEELATPPPPLGERPRARPVPGRVENLVVEFDEAYTAFVEGFDALPSESQMIALQAVDAKLTRMVGAKDASLWSEAALAREPVWQEVRKLAADVLREFDWVLRH